MGNPEDAAFDDVFLPGGPVRPDLLDTAASHALEQAVRLARETRWDRVRSPHLFMGLLVQPNKGVRDWGKRLRADLPLLLEQFRELFQQDATLEEPYVRLHREFVSDNVLVVLRDAWRRTVENGREQVTPMDLLISVLGANNSIVAECFERIGIPAGTLTRLAVLAEGDRGGETPGGEGPGV